MRRFLLLVLLAGFPALSSATAQPTALVGPTALNPVDSTVIQNATVVLKGDSIAVVDSSGAVTVPDSATVHEMPDKYVMPGLIDGHVHFFQSGGLYTRPDAIDLRAVRPYSEELRRIKERLPDTFRRYVRSGVTSVMDVGGPMWNLDVRARADTTAMAPTVVTAGPLISSVSRPSLSEGDPPIKKITSPAAAREEVRKQVAAGVDLLVQEFGGGELRGDAEPRVGEHRPDVLDRLLVVHPEGRALLADVLGGDDGLDVVGGALLDQKAPFRVEEEYGECPMKDALTVVAVAFRQRTDLAVRFVDQDQFPPERRLAQGVLHAIDEGVDVALLVEEGNDDRHVGLRGNGGGVGGSAHTNSWMRSA